MDYALDAMSRASTIWSILQPKMCLLLKDVLNVWESKIMFLRSMACVSHACKSKRERWKSQGFLSYINNHQIHQFIQLLHSDIMGNALYADSMIIWILRMGFAIIVSKLTKMQATFISMKKRK